VTGGNVPRRRRSHHHAIGAYDSLSIHQALRACEVGSCKGENVTAITKMSTLMGAIFVRGEGGRSFLRLAKSVTRFEKVASSFEKRATTCTEHVMFESLLFCSERRERRKK